MSNILRRFGLEAATAGLHDPYENLDKPKDFLKVRRIMKDEPEKSAPVPEVTVKPKLAELKDQISAIPARKAKGRPKVEDSISSQKPWEAEGVSRMTWYRRQKSAKPSEGKGDV